MTKWSSERLFFSTGFPNVAYVSCLPVSPPPLCSTENEPSILDLQASGGAAPVGGFFYSGCQSRRLHRNYVFGDKNG